MFFHGFTDELVKLANSSEEGSISYNGINIPGGMAKSLASAAAKGLGEGTAKETAEQIGKYKKEITGATIGGLAGKSLANIKGLRKIPIRGAGGMLLGLAASQSGKVVDAVKEKLGKNTS